MKEIRRKELELLEKICKQNNVSLKLAREVIKTSRKFSYENVSKGNRLNEYEKLIDYYSNEK